MATKLNRWHLFYTVLILLNNFAFGLNNTLFGAIVVDLRVLYGVSINTMSYMDFPSSLGYLVGSLASLVYRWVNRQLALAGFLLLMAANTFAVPFLSASIWLFFADCLVTGVGTGGYDSGYSIWLVEMWPEHHAAMLQAALFVSGVGATVGPLAAAPFVHGELKNSTTTTTTNSSAAEDYLQNNGTSIEVMMEERRWDLGKAVGIAGGTLCIAPIFFIALYFTSRRYRKPEEEQEDQNQNQTKQQKADINNNNKLAGSADSISAAKPQLDPAIIRHRLPKLALLALSYALYIPAEAGYLFYSATIWQYLEIELSAPQAALMMSLLTGCYTAGRLLATFIALKVKPDITLAAHYLLIAASLTLLFFGRTNLTVVYVGHAALGFGYSAMNAAFYSLTEQHLKLTEKVCSLYSFTGAGVALVMPLVLGQTLDHFPKVIWLLEGVLVGGSLALFVLVRFWILVDSRRRR